MQFKRRFFVRSLCLCHVESCRNSESYIWMCQKIIDDYCVCNIWMICLEVIWFFYDPNWILQLVEFLWTLCSFLWVDFNNFLLIYATDRSKNKISSNHHWIFFEISLYLLSFYKNTPFQKLRKYTWRCSLRLFGSRFSISNPFPAISPTLLM